METVSTSRTLIAGKTRRYCAVAHQRRTLKWLSSLFVKPIWFPALIALLTPISTSAIPSCNSLCDCRPQAAWCEGRGLTSIPKDLPLDTRQLFLFNNNISSIPEGAIRRLKDLQLIDLSSNKLTNSAVKPGVFSGLKRLHDLTLSDNKLTSIETGTFSGLDSLTRLYLEDNRISVIESNALGNFSNLVELKLSHNRLSSFPRIVNCPNLRRLYLSDNRLIRLHGSLDNVNLEQLTLANNLLNQIPSTTFRNTNNMRVLDISQNRIQRLPRSIRNMTSLHTLNLSRNAIASLPGNLLQKLRHLKVLDLRGLRLTTLAKGFIPARVYLNIFDLSNNPWKCNCDIAWLPEYMRNVGRAIANREHVQCSLPTALRGRQIRNLSPTNELHCVSSSTEDTEKQQPILRPPPTRKPTVDLCDALACANGATCHIDQNTGRPICRCLPGWRGLLCDDLIYVPTTTLTSTISTAGSGKPQLMFDRSTLTSHSVVIIIPTVGKEIKVTVSEIYPNGAAGPSITNKIRPERHPYNVTKLHAGKKYNICISSIDIIQTSAWRSRKVEDQLCGEITTLAESNHVPADEGKNNVVRNPEPEPGHNTPMNTVSGVVPYQNSDNSAATNSEQTDLLIPAIVAGVAVFLALLVAIFLFKCYRRKIKAKHTNNNGIAGSDRPNVKGIHVSTDCEMKPMISQQHKQHSVHHATSPINQNVYPVSRQSFHNVGQVPQRVSTPNRAESLGGRSSNSGVSINCPQQAYNDVQRNSPNAVGMRYCIPVEDVRTNTATNGSIYNSIFATDGVAVTSNRGQEFAYPHGTTMDNYVDTSFKETVVPTVLVPVGSTTTTVNQFHQSPISTTTISPQINYHQPENTVVISPNGYSMRPDVTRAQQYVPPHRIHEKHPRYNDMYDQGPRHHVKNGINHVYRDAVVT